ncbi:Acetyl esterase/lipase [Malonomonas rubra DSM 5091]|uniref:Acetyl esterase/lipase n=1 Tax=Malonomonas rubra DSM 5091 TaxID=1122189 RepID=A0A1M6MIF0_MALRU|nr:alpha/beta hydrolase [Malonomonas rubra]SHJ83291.1 Acetyl esterase/lipase [Malonomonas rubra DSM 5091]
MSKPQQRHAAMNKAFFILMLILACCLAGIDMADANTGTPLKARGGEYTHLTTDGSVRDLVEHPAFKGFSQLMLPTERDIRYLDTPLSNVRSLMPYHGHVNPDTVVVALNHMIDEVNDSRTVFYDFYTDQQKLADPDKENTGLFFYRGAKGAPFAIVCPGGGFSYVGSLHEGFPLASEVSRKMLNAFVIRYRIGSQLKATQDLAAAISYILRNAEELGVSRDGYSLWGGSAGARMVGHIALSGVAAYGGEDLPKPSTVVIAYTGQSSFSEDFPPTFMTSSANDGIASVSSVDKRVKNLRDAGVEVEYQRYRTAGHGFGLGTGTDAEGWLDLAIQFWQKQLNKTSSR